MITVYDAWGVPHQVTLQEFIQIEADRLAELFEMSESDPAK
jgi:hypothetical protein